MAFQFIQYFLSETVRLEVAIPHAIESIQLVSIIKLALLGVTINNDLISYLLYPFNHYN